MQQYWERAKEVLEENFGHKETCALGTRGEFGPNVSNVYTYYEDGKFYFITDKNSQKVVELTAHDFVCLCCKNSKIHGKAKVIGHPRDEQNQEIRREMKHAFGSAYNTYFNDHCEDAVLVQVEVVRAVTFTKMHRYMIDFETGALSRERHNEHFDISKYYRRNF